MFGSGVTVTVTVRVAVQPLLVPVIVYVRFCVGVDITVAPLVVFRLVPGLQV